MLLLLDVHHRLGPRRHAPAAPGRRAGRPAHLSPHARGRAIPPQQDTSLSGACVHTGAVIAEHALTWSPRHPTDLLQTIGALRRGGGDPTYHRDERGAVWRTTRTDEGVATLRYTQPASDELRCEGWGPGARAGVAAAPELLGERDDPGGFEPGIRLLDDAHRRNPGLRIPRTGRVFEALAPAILEQKVDHAAGARLVAAARLAVRRRRSRADPAARCEWPPSPERWASIPTWEWHTRGRRPAPCPNDRERRAVRVPPRGGGRA